MFEKSDRLYLAVFLIAATTTLPFSLLHKPEESYVVLQKDLKDNTIASLRFSGDRVIVRHKGGDEARVILPFGSTFPDEAIKKGIPVTIKSDALWLGVAIAFLGQVLVGGMACCIVFLTRKMRKP